MVSRDAPRLHAPAFILQGSAGLSEVMSGQDAPSACVRLGNPPKFDVRYPAVSTYVHRATLLGPEQLRMQSIMEEARHGLGRASRAISEYPSCPRN